MKELIAKGLMCNRIFFCHLCIQQQKNKDSTLDQRLNSLVEMKIYLVYCTFKNILFVFLLMSACQIIVYQLPFQSKSELKLAEHKGNFKAAKYHCPELHLPYIFATSKLQQIEEQAFQGHQPNMVFSSNNLQFYGVILFKH